MQVGERQLQLFCEVERQRLERTGFPKHCKIGPSHARTAQQNLGDVTQFLKRLGKDHSSALDQRAH